MAPKLKHNDGSAACVRCGTLTACAWLEPAAGELVSACPPCARYLFDHPEARAAIVTGPAGVAGRPASRG